VPACQVLHFFGRRDEKSFLGSAGSCPMHAKRSENDDLESSHDPNCDSFSRSGYLLRRLSIALRTHVTCYRSKTLIAILSIIVSSIVGARQISRVNPMTRLLLLQNSIATISHISSLLVFLL